MRVVVIDNIEWDGAKISDTDFQDNQMPWCVSTLNKSMDTIKTELEIDAKNDIFKDEDVHCYLINVHCAIYRLKDKTNYEMVTPYQAQAGVDIYRELLHLYRECSEKLRVVFFSPYAEKSELLFHKKPENLILKHLEYLQVPFTWKQVQDKFKQYNKPVFNNASENLLSGYSLYHNQHPIKSKVSTGKKKILFIDDQSNEWKAVFNEIFHEDVIEHLTYNNQEEFRQNLANGQVEKNVKSKLTQCQMVLSDFYLNENHDPGKWMNRENIEKISGFDLFHSIRNTDKGKAIPYIMHTSSNKIPYYKVFDQNGVDDWLVKDVRANSTRSEKIDSYMLFKKTLEGVCQKSAYDNLQKLWLDIVSINNITNDKWWYSPEYYPNKLSKEFIYFRPVNNKPNPYEPKFKHTKDDIVKILATSWNAIREHVIRESSLDENNYKLRISDSEHFVSAAICNSIGKVIEILGIKSGDKGFSFLTNFLLQMRNCASHSDEHEYFCLEDAFICLSYLVYGLKNYDTIDSFRSNFKDVFIVKGKTDQAEDNFPCGLLWLYLQLYNDQSTSTKPELKLFRESVKSRIKTLYNIAENRNLVRDVFNVREKLSDGNSKTFLYKIFSDNTKLNNKNYLNGADPIKLPIPSKL